MPLFQAYAAQDAHFLQSFAKAYAHALTKAEDPKTVVALSGLIAAVVEELELHASVLEKEGGVEGGSSSSINSSSSKGDENGKKQQQEQQQQQQQQQQSCSSSSSSSSSTSTLIPSPACLAYTSFLLSVASSPSSSISQILAAMTPCMRLYAHVGSRLVEVQEGVGEGGREGGKEGGAGDAHVGRRLVEVQGGRKGREGGENQTMMTNGGEQTSASSSSLSSFPPSLRAWLDTYSGPAFEASAAAVEALIDEEFIREKEERMKRRKEGREGGKEDEEGREEGRLFSLYHQAMQLEYNFFAEQWEGGREGGREGGTEGGRGVWKGYQPLLLVTDFDSTCSIADTTHLLPKAAGYYKGPFYSPEKWKELEDSYLSQLAQVMPPLLEGSPPSLPPFSRDLAADVTVEGTPSSLPPSSSSSSSSSRNPQKEEDLAAAAAHLAPLDAFDLKAVQSVTDSNILKGINLSLLPSLLLHPNPSFSSSDPSSLPSSLPSSSSFAPSLALQPYCARVLRYADTLASSSSSSPPPSLPSSSPSSLPPSSSPFFFHVLSVSWSSLLITTATGLHPSRVTCNQLESEGGRAGGREEGVLSTGKINVIVDGPRGKLRHFRRFQDEAGSEGVREGGREGGSVFIGDSVTDILALMAADVGIVVGESGTLRKMLTGFGWEVRPLLAFPVEGREGGREGGRVVWAAGDWAEIAVFLYGRRGAEVVREGGREKGSLER